MYNIKITEFLPFNLRVNLLKPTYPHLWNNDQALIWRWTWDLGEGYLVVPAYYQCDGASIPFRFYDVVDPICALRGSFGHDLMYQTQCGFRPNFNTADPSTLVNEKENTIQISNFDTNPSMPRHHERRARADALLFHFWLADGMSRSMAEKGYLAVRALGKSAWISEEPNPDKPPLTSALLDLTNMNLVPVN